MQPHTVAPTDVSDTPEGLASDGLAPAHLAPEGWAPEGSSGGKDLPAQTRHPGSVPFVSNRAGAYGWLLLATYVRWPVGTFINVPHYIMKCCIYVAGLLETGRSMFGAGHVLPDYGLEQGLSYIIVC